MAVFDGLVVVGAGDGVTDGWIVQCGKPSCSWQSTRIREESIDASLDGLEHRLDVHREMYT